MISLAGAGLALSLLAASALAQEPLPNTPPKAPAPGPARDCGEEYRVGSGDTLELVVLGNDDLSRVAAVRPDGAVALPLVGDVKVAGASIPEIKERLATAFARYVLSPQIDVQVRDYNSRFAALVGEVGQPGRRAVGPCTRVIDLLLQAGGFRDGASAEVVVSHGEENADTLRVRVERGVFTSEARRVLETVLHGGEIVTVLPRPFLTVQGEVARPNRYAIEGRLTVTGAVNLAGGLTRSASTKVKIVRTAASGERRVLEADLKEIRDGKAEDAVLQGDDIVTVARRFF
jgi:polysaccharide export outer membrane protein